MASNFETAVFFVMLNEGGAAYTNAPLDRGGPTRFGVTLATLSAARGTQQTANDVATMTLCDAEGVYRRLFWDPLRLDSVASESLATAMLDIAVLCGPGTSARLAQTAVRVKVDGVVGPLTLAALNASAAAPLIANLSSSLLQYLTNLVGRDATQQKWLAGWTVRAKKLLTLRDAVQA